MIPDLGDVDAFAEDAHRGQWRYIGDRPPVPYIVHPRAVRDVLLHEHPEPGVREPWLLATALLHDVLEDCPVSHATLTDRFGADVSAAVRALSKQLRADPRATKTDDQYWQVLAQSPRPIRQVKAADRIDNLRTCLMWPDTPLSRRYLSETPRRVLPLVADDAFLAETLADLLARLARAVS